METEETLLNLHYHLSKYPTESKHKAKEKKYSQAIFYDVAFSHKMAS